MYAVFENTGALDFRAMTVMGINAKPNTDSPIGYFGTGMKYAIAVLARLECELRIQDGVGNEYKAEAYDTIFRDKNFQMIRLVNVNDDRDYVELPFTTELGKNWQPWMVIRELECNARDEGGKYTAATSVPAPEEGIVRFIVSGGVFEHDMKDIRRKVFFDVANEGTTVHSFSSIEYVCKPSNQFYMRNICVQEFQKEFAFTYNSTHSMDLTEDRTLKYVWEIDSPITALFCHGPNEYRDVLFNNEDALEWTQIPFPQTESSYAPAALKHIEDHYNANGFLNDGVKRMVHNRRVRLAMERSRDLSHDESEVLETALDRLELLGYDVRRYKIIHSDKLPHGVLGVANSAKRTINIAQANFEMGLECLMGTLLEEYAHLHYGHVDHSRQFQDWLLRQIVMNGQRYIRQLKRETTNMTIKLSSEQRYDRRQRFLKKPAKVTQPILLQSLFHFERADLTFEEIAVRAGYNYTILSHLRNGRAIPKVGTLNDLLNAIGYELAVVPMKGGNNGSKS